MIPCAWMKIRSDGRDANMWEVLTALDDLPHCELKRILATYLHDRGAKRVETFVSKPVLFTYLVTAVANQSIVSWDDLKEFWEFVTEMLSTEKELDSVSVHHQLNFKKF